MQRISLSAALTAALFVPTASAQHAAWDMHRPDAHGPALVMKDHVHAHAGWMFSVRAMTMRMEGLLRGSSSLSNPDLFGGGYMVAPESMEMNMLMFGGMYAPSDDLTLMVMVPYVQKKMDLVTMGGVHFTTEAEGLGDIALAGMTPILDRGDTRAHAALGLFLPTGSTDERDATPMSASAKLPYPMQLGTGTFDLEPGATWMHQRGVMSFGAQAQHRVSLDLNDEGYRHGARTQISAWAAAEVSPALSVSTRLAWHHSERFHGADDDLNPALVPTADARFTGRERLDLGLGVNYRTPGGSRFGAELSLPLDEDVNGIQMETDWTLGVVWQFAM